MSEPTKLDREGIFRVAPLEFGITEGKDGSLSVGIAINFQILAQLGDNGQWIDWGAYNVVCEGTFYIVDRTGLVQEKQVKSLIAALGWTGALEQFADPAWVPLKCQINVKRESYNNADRYRAAWINPWDFKPSKMYGVEPARLAALKTRLDADLCAIARGETLPKAVAPPGPPPDMDDATLPF